MKGGKRIALKKFPAVLSELTEWLINGKKCLRGPDAVLHVWCTEPRVQICKESLGRSSNQHTGCWPCSKQACKLLTAKCRAARARTSHTIGTAPGLGSNLDPDACPRPRCWLASLTHQAMPVFQVQSHATAAHTGPFVQKYRTHEQRQFPLVLSSKPGKKGLAVKLPDQPALRMKGFLAESYLAIAHPEVQPKGTRPELRGAGWGPSAALAY